MCFLFPYIYFEKSSKSFLILYCTPAIFFLQFFFITLVIIFALVLLFSILENNLRLDYWIKTMWGKNCDKIAVLTRVKIKLSMIDEPIFYVVNK